MEDALYQGNIITLDHIAYAKQLMLGGRDIRNEGQMQ
jgi:hypothetical protein